MESGFVLSTRWSRRSGMSHILTGRETRASAFCRWSLGCFGALCSLAPVKALATPAPRPTNLGVWLKAGGRPEVQLQFALQTLLCLGEATFQMALKSSTWNNSLKFKQIPLAQELQHLFFSWEFPAIQTPYVLTRLQPKAYTQELRWVNVT